MILDELKGTMEYNSSPEEGAQSAQKTVIKEEPRKAKQPIERLSGFETKNRRLQKRRI